MKFCHWQCLPPNFYDVPEYFVDWNVWLWLRVVVPKFNLVLSNESKIISCFPRVRTLPNLLKSKGIEVIKDNENVGENLQDHLMLRPVYTVKNIDTLNQLYNSYYRKFHFNLI